MATMGTIVVQTDNEEQVKLVSNVFRRLELKSLVLSVEDKEDIVPEV